VELASISNLDCIGEGAKGTVFQCCVRLSDGRLQASAVKLEKVCVDAWSLMFASIQHTRRPNDGRLRAAAVKLVKVS
jgi:hypothetical protein